MQLDGILFYNFVILLVIELGNPFTVRATLLSLNLMAAVVVLTVRRGYNECAYTPPTFDREAQPPYFS